MTKIKGRWTMGKAKKMPNSVLTDKQQRFAELVAHDMDAHEAYREAYGYTNPNPRMLDNKTRLVLNNSKVIAEIERIQMFEMDGKYNSAKNKEEMLAKHFANETNNTGVNSTNKEANQEWTQELVFNKLKEFLDNNDQALAMLKERPQLFATVRKQIDKVKTKLSGVHIDDEKWKRELLETFENIEDMISAIGEFNIKEYNSTVSTGMALMKEINAVTGVTKNVQELKRRSFEDRLLDMIAENKDNQSNNLVKELEAYAYEDNTD